MSQVFMSLRAFFAKQSPFKRRILLDEIYPLTGDCFDGTLRAPARNDILSRESVISYSSHDLFLQITMGRHDLKNIPKCIDQTDSWSSKHPIDTGNDNCQNDNENNDYLKQQGNIEPTEPGNGILYRNSKNVLKVN